MTSVDDAAIVVFVIRGVDWRRPRRPILGVIECCWGDGVDCSRPLVFGGDVFGLTLVCGLDLNR